MKTRMKKIVAAACLMAGFAAFGIFTSAQAATHGWSNTGKDAASWYTVANWTNATGAAASAAPITAGTSAFFPYIDKTTRSVNLMGTAYDDRTQAPVIDSIAGGEYWRLILPAGDNGWGRCYRSVKVGDINGFKGVWYSEGAYQTLDLSNATEDQKLQVVYPNYHFPIKVPAGITAEMGYVRGSTGAIAKEGAGKLKIGTVMDAETLQLQLNGGEVELAGVIGPEDAIIKKAYYHFDANLPETMETYTDGDGRTRVTKWMDANGSGRYASTWDNSGDKTASHLKFVNAPFVTKNSSTTGLSVMDFGSASSSASEMAKYGPTNCTLMLSERLTPREIIWVAGWNNGTNPVFGDNSNYTFVGGTDKIFTYGTTITNGGGAFWHNANYRAETPLAPDYLGLCRFATPYDTYSPKWTDLRVCDIKLGETSTQKIHYFSTDRLYADSVGGVKMGEVLIFTNALTDAERQLVGNYLMKRWFANRPHSEFRNVYAAANTAISVPAGRTAKIDNLVARGTVTKKGAGTLVIGRTVQDPNLVVEEGDVQFETKTYDISDDAPAGTPQFWYDADQEDCFVTGENGVTNWKDRREAYATARQTALHDGAKACPQIDTTSLPGHTVLSFGAGAFMGMPSKIGTGYAFQRETFIVFAFADNTGAANHTFLPNGCYTCVRDAYRFQNPDYVDDKLAGGVFTMDGVPEYAMEPATGNRAFKAGEWHVASAAAFATLNMNGLARDGGRNRVGRLKIGEVITYSGALTEDQRRQTVAYLMKKWLGKSHPESEEPAVKPALTFGADDPAVVKTENGAEIESVAGGNGDLVKKGAGDATIVADLADSFGNVTVAGGSLTIAKPVEPQDRSVYHFDAMDTASFADYFIDANGETNVNRWADTRGNGVYAYKPEPFMPNPSGSDWMYMTNPIVRHVTFPDGKTRPILDFLKSNWRNVNPPTGAGLYLSNTPTWTAGALNIKELHYIFGNGQSAMNVFNGRYSCCFLRGLWNQLFRNGSQAAAVSTDIQNGYISVNNQTADSTYVLDNNKFYLVSAAPLSAQDAWAIGVDRMDNAGGDRYGECIAFTEYLPAKERAYLQAKLLRKWIDQTAPEAVWTNELDSVTLAAGTTLTVDGGAVSAPAITGGGTIDATKVLGIAAINLGAGETLTIEGVADFANAVTVDLAGSAALKPGSYTLVSATSLANFDPSKWTLSAKPKYPTSFKQVGNSVVLEVQKRGLIFIIN